VLETRPEATPGDRPGPGKIDVDDGLDTARVRAEHDHAIRHRDGLEEIVGDEDHRLAVPFPDAQKLVLQDQLGLGVEGTERLVHQYDVGIDGEGARQRDPLPHALRQLAGIAGLEPLKADDAQELPGPLPALPHRPAPQLEPELHIGKRRAPGQERVAREHVANSRVEPGHRPAVYRHAPGRGAKSPEMIFSSVDLPQPLGPMIATNSPSSTSRLMSASASTSRPSISNRCDRLLIAIFV